MSPHVAARLRITLLVLAVSVVQTALGSDLRIMGVAPDLMVVVVICAGLTGGAEAGAWVGFWSGLLMDMFLSSTPVGLSALTYCLVGASIGALKSSVLQEHRGLLPVAGFVGTAVAVMLFVVVGDVLGQTQLLGAGRSWLIRVVVIESLWSMVLALSIGFVYTRAARGSVGTERFRAPANPAVPTR
ncbi:MAG: rod shape-determining protein MreD [Acidimicrobiales bacterium]|nr:rod shape-determining protein MreD [Acidimicrobiales bacterium]